MNKNLFGAFILASGVLSGTASAVPTVTMAAALSNVTFTVFDINPADGIAAGYSVSNLATGLDVKLEQHPADGSTVRGDATERPPFASSVDVARDGSRAEAIWGGANGALGVTSHNALVALPDLTAAATQTMTITLAPHTGFIVSGQSFQEMRADAHGWGGTGSALTTVELSTGLTTTSLRYRQAFNGSIADDYADHDLFSLSYVNEGDVARALTLSFSIDAQTHVSAAPVPEPSAWLMLGAGLLGVAARHRHRAARPAALA